jgi:hypothetical protein
VQRVLYLFAGVSRPGDVRHNVESKDDYVVEEFDICQGNEFDLSCGIVFRKLIQDVKAGIYTAILASPPCSTWSRERHANRKGPPAVRSKEWPLGLPWLKGKLAAAVPGANLLLDRTIELSFAHQESQGTFNIEHPENLGCRSNGQAWQTPASIWDLPRLRILASSSNTFPCALHQCSFGAVHSKPTRLVVSGPTAPERLETVFWALPSFDEQGRYLGPLPSSCRHAHTPALGKHKGRFITSDAAAYPDPFCKFLADQVSMPPRNHHARRKARVGRQRRLMFARHPASGTHIYERFLQGAQLVAQGGRG